MTRRTRFSPFLVRGVFAGAVVLAGAAVARAGDVPFVAQPPITTPTPAFSVAAADLDGDGDRDVLVASPSDDTVAWYENSAGDGSAWAMHAIATGAVSASKVHAADVDGDGDMDVLAAYGATLAWYENTLGDASAWAAHTIALAGNVMQDVFAADIDGDGDRDVVSTYSDSAGSEAGVTWHENTAGDGSAWATHTISTLPFGSVKAVAVDVDGDGDLDVVSSLAYSPPPPGGHLRWYENSAGDGSAWTTHTLPANTYNIRALFAADVDGDGDIDVLTGSSFDGLLAWYENASGDGSSWTPHTISTLAPGAFSIFAADLDSDGDLDLLSGSYDPGESLSWYENTLGDGSAWTKHGVPGAPPIVTVFAADVDGDGDPDALAGFQTADTVAWYRNESIHGSACFAPSTAITTSAGFGGSLSGADVDGDGDVDVLSASSSGLLWFENTGGDGSTWTAHTVSQLYGGPVSAADLDGDGDLDILGTLPAPPYAEMVWYENTTGNGSAWTTHTISDPFGYLLSLSAADIDGDGDLDVVVGRHVFLPYSDIGWWENTAGNGMAWNPHYITSAVLAYASQAADVDGDGDLDVLYGAHGQGTVGWAENLVPGDSPWPDHPISSAPYVNSAIPADIDGDGDLDAVATSYSNYADSYLVWYENTAGNGGAWTNHTITTAIGGASVFGADLDGDGDVDLVVAVRTAGAVLWYENSGNGSLWTAHTLASVASPVSVLAADVDGDGRADAISASYTNDTVAWHPNHGGQFSLTGSDMAPAVAPDASLVSLLRIDAAHLGRAGDHDLELLSLGLLFEQAPGVPLTSKEANALVESLRVYRDENGNGAFDPATDTLVVSLPTLALVGGVETLAFADGDPNVAVAQAAPRTFFLVAELTANASQQSPNHFRVTHLDLGPSASVAEDRDFDIPLRPACPSDAASGVVSAGQAAYAVRATKTVSGSLREGGTIAYAVTLTNLGTNPQPDTPADELLDVVPSSLTVTGADDAGDPGSVSVLGNTVRWNGAIPASSSVAVTIQATVNAGTAGSVISNQGTIAYDSDGNGTGDTTHPTDDPALPGASDPTSFTPAAPLRGDLVHGSDRVLDLSASGVGTDLFGFRQEPGSSYEVVVDGTTGDIGAGGSGPALELVAADGTTVLATSLPAGAGPSRSLRFENASAGAILDQGVRVRSLGCTTDCTAEDRYRVRAWETTLSLPRLNNSASQTTVLVLQNPTAAVVTGNVWLRDAGGALAASVAFSIPPHGTLVQNTAALAPALGGSLSISHDAPYGALAGKAVAVEPATGFTFDTPVLPRGR